MTKSGIQGVEPSPRFSFCRFFFPLCPYEHGAKRLPLLKPSYCITLSGECRCELKIPYFITCHLSDNLQSRPRPQRQTPLINAHSRTLKLYHDYSTHSKIFQMQVDFPGVDFLSTTFKQQEEKDEFALVCPRPLKNVTLIKEFYVIVFFSVEKCMY